MSGSLRIRCFAKINTVLRVIGRRPDGYHELDTEFVSLQLHDTLVVEPANGFTLRVEGAPESEVPTADNLVLRAAAALQDEAGASRLPGARMTLTKRIPAAAGLGGGSSDAAGALQGLARMTGLDVSEERLAALALAIGSDVPYFLQGGRRRGRGRGEQLTPLPDLPETAVLLLKPRFPLSTRLVFEAHARLKADQPDRAFGSSLTRRKIDTRLEQRFCWSGDPVAVHDDLADAAVSLEPMVGEVARAAEECFPEGVVGMTGSGPTLFVLLPPGAGDVTARAKAALPDVDAWLTRTLSEAAYRATRFA